VLLPVSNGEAWLAAKLESILALDYPRELLQIIVIVNGSTDRSEEIALRYAPRGVDLIRLERAGKAEAINAGLASARGEILFFTDVRQPLDPASLARLVECFADPAVGAASGELFIGEGETREEADTGLYWRYEKWIRKRQSAIDSVLGATGCIYAMRRELAAPLPPGTLLDDVYLPLAAFFRGYRVILEEAARAYDRPTSLAAEFRRKVRTQAGVYQLLRAYPALLGPRNRMWIHFVSHKLGRLVAPFALIAAALASFGLAPPWRTAALAVQAGFYGLGLVDAAVPGGWALKRLTSPVRTFLVLMAAALAAASILFRPGQELWKQPG
jgi:cellulose synthase/poly-beta-1,6-N-acetylglucosamine synthase-like glycosyltransferase